MDGQRISSLVVYAGYLAFAALALNMQAFFQLLVFLLFPMACIWFGDEMGDYTGFTGLFRPNLSRATPGYIIRFFGWVLLALPSVVLAYFALVSGNK